MSQENVVPTENILVNTSAAMNLYADENIVKGTVIDGQGYHAEVSKDENNEIVLTGSASEYYRFDLERNGVYSVTAYDKNGYQKADFKMPEESEESEESDEHDEA